MEIGSTLHLEYRISERTEKYYCKIIEKKGKYLFIDYPINESTKKTTYFPENISFKATFIEKDNVVYSFNAKILGKVKLTIPALIIEHPKKEDLKAIQRREFVRVEEAVDIAVHCPENNFEPFTAVTVDISAGGLAFYLPNEGNIQAKKTLNIWLAFQMNSGEFHYISTKGKVIRINLLRSTIESCSVKFIDISKQSQQKIIYYCFERQREARRKEFI